MKIRTGLGFDVHELKPGGPLILGGVRIPSEVHADGHSDADVLIHAICDALLGAAGMRDIGFHFSNKDERWRNADSRIFLEQVAAMIRAEGWEVANVDCTVVLEAPKINPYVPEMQQVLTAILGLEAGAVSVKATTNETMGYVGRREGINAFAAALITRA